MTDPSTWVAAKKLPYDGCIANSSGSLFLLLKLRVCNSNPVAKSFLDYAYE